MRHLKNLKLLIFLLVISLTQNCFADTQTAKEWINKEFQPSTLNKQEQLKEMTWFMKAAKPFKGMEIRVVSERIDTHWYEASVLAKAFRQITGINVIHEITGEDDVIKKIDTHLKKNIHLYDIYINDSDLIGTHFRSKKVVALSDFIKNEGKEVTLPTLDLNDFMGLPFVTGPDKKVYQLPDQQFANLYWYRADWFEREDFKKRFKKIYGYELNVPVNWSAYEDIAEFFTVHIKQIDGVKIYGHMDYGKKDPSIGWRFSDAWLSMAGVGDTGLPNGLPVDEWGIRVENCKPVGASVSRGGAANSPAAIYALRKFDEWLKKYAPPSAKNMNFSQAGAVASKGHIAQQIFWYTAFTASMTKKGLAVVNEDGTPKWKMAPSPHGVYWQKGMKLGYQDAGSWTMLNQVPLKRKKAAWLYAQFVVSKTVSLKKTIVGLTPIRKSDINSDYMTKIAPKLGGLVEFYRSKARLLWTPTGTNVPDYPLLSPAWWKTVPKVIDEGLSAKEAMNELATYLDDKLFELSQSNNGNCSPSLNKKKDPMYWFKQKGSPKIKLINEKPKGITVPYEESLRFYE